MLKNPKYDKALCKLTEVNVNLRKLYKGNTVPQDCVFREPDLKHLFKWKAKVNVLKKVQKPWIALNTQSETADSRHTVNCQRPSVQRKKKYMNFDVKNKIR